MQIGLVGKKYGLQRPAGLSLFKQDDEEESDVNKIIRDASEKKAQKQKQQDQAKVLSEDPTAYDYDSVYDAMHQSRRATAPQKDASRKPKYIHALLEKAAIRNREQDIIYSRMLQKERETEGNTYAGKEKFITSAYKKQLQENKLWQEEEERKAALEEDVTKKEDLGSFYVNLLTRNEAYGGGRRSSPPKDTAVGRDEDRAHRSGKDNKRNDMNDRSKDNTASADPPRSTDDLDRVDSEREGKQDIRKDEEDATKKRPRESPSRKEPEHDIADAPTGEDTTKLARRKNDASTVSAARERYLKRKAQTQL